MCEDMWHLIQEIRRERPFELESCDVDSDQEIRERYGLLVPVLTFNEEIVCNYFLDPVAVKNCLEREQGE